MSYSSSCFVEALVSTHALRLSRSKACASDFEAGEPNAEIENLFLQSAKAAKSSGKGLGLAQHSIPFSTAMAVH